MGGAVWFKTHKLAMIATLVLSLLGMVWFVGNPQGRIQTSTSKVPVVIDRKLDPIKRLEYHPMVGLATVVICIFQPVIAYFRPGKVSKRSKLVQFDVNSNLYSKLLTTTY